MNLSGFKIVYPSLLYTHPFPVTAQLGSAPATQDSIPHCCKMEQ